MDQLVITDLKQVVGVLSPENSQGRGQDESQHGRRPQLLGGAQGALVGLIGRPSVREGHPALARKGLALAQGTLGHS